MASTAWTLLKKLGINNITPLPVIEIENIAVLAPENEAEGKIETVLAIHKELSSKADLRPCETINTLFEQLVEVCAGTVGSDVTEMILSDARIKVITPSLRRICAVAEGFLEAESAKLIIGSGEDAQDEDAVFERLKAFPYYTNYVDITRMELAAIYSILPTPTQTPRKFAFIGSGPLPLTSICILQALSSLELSPFKNPSSQSATVLNIDVSPAAITTSQSLCWALGSRSDGMEFLCADAAGSSYDFWDFHIVYLAALVGSTQEEKEDVLVKVVEKMRPGAVLVVRSAERARRLMYPEFDPTTTRVQGVLEVCVAVNPYTHIVNSVIVGRVKAR